MKIISQLKIAISDLIKGRPVPVQKIFTVNIKKRIRKDTAIETPRVDMPSPIAPTMWIDPFTDSPVVSVPVEETSASFNHFINENKDLISRYLLGRIEVAIEKNIDSVIIYRFETSENIFRISKTEYEVCLNKLMEYFVRIEDYKFAAFCRDAIKQHKFNESIISY